MSTTITSTASGSAVQPRLRLTRRGRVVFTTLAAIPLVAVALAMTLNGGMATADSVGGDLQYVSVESGGSLWAIAQELAPREDPREVIAQIIHFNQLESADVASGQSLAIPTRYAR